MKHYTFQREIPIESSYDVVVAGGDKQQPAASTGAIIIRLVMAHRL
jgi:hypothetical protein